MNYQLWIETSERMFFMETIYTKTAPPGIITEGENDLLTALPKFLYSYSSLEFLIVDDADDGAHCVQILRRLINRLHAILLILQILVT